MNEKMIVHENVLFEADKLNDKLKVNPWAGHRDFVYDLVSFLKPNIIVELGTHYGCSFFSFIQAIKDNKLDTKIYGIDSWEGEEHAGKYGGEVYQIVQTTVKTYFSQQNIYLLKTYFDQAIEQFDDNSIDILHIDGLHTYDATKSDFFNYLPKLKKNGIVLFHDIANYTGYGSHKFWEEIKLEYKNYFEFKHSWGLGVLFPKGNDNYLKLVNQNINDKIKIYQYKAENELNTIKLNDHMQMIDERDKTIEAQTQMIDERDKTIEAQTHMIDERDIYIKTLENKLNGI